MLKPGQGFVPCSGAFKRDKHPCYVPGWFSGSLPAVLRECGTRRPETQGPAVHPRLDVGAPGTVRSVRPVRSLLAFHDDHLGAPPCGRLVASLTGGLSVVRRLRDVFSRHWLFPSAKPPNSCVIYVRLCCLLWLTSLTCLFALLYVLLNLNFAKLQVMSFCS